MASGMAGFCVRINGYDEVWWFVEEMCRCKPSFSNAPCCSDNCCVAERIGDWVVFTPRGVIKIRMEYKGWLRWRRYMCIDVRGDYSLILDVLKRFDQRKIKDLWVR